MLDADAMTQDGVAASALSRAEGAPDEQAPPSRGPLLDEPDGKKVARMVRDLVDAQKGWHSYNCAIWSRNRQWRKGRRGIRIVEDTDTNTFDVRLPAGASQAAPTPNNIDKLIPIPAKYRKDVGEARITPAIGDCDDESNPVTQALYGLAKFIWEKRIEMPKKVSQKAAKPKQAVSPVDINEDCPY
jgi:hypothetical protein